MDTTAEKLKDVMIIYSHTLLDGMADRGSDMTAQDFDNVKTKAFNRYRSDFVFNRCVDMMVANILNITEVG